MIMDEYDRSQYKLKGQPKPTPTQKKNAQRMDFSTFGPRISKEYKQIMKKHKASQERLNKRGPFLNR